MRDTVHNDAKDHLRGISVWLKIVWLDDAWLIEASVGFKLSVFVYCLYCNGCLCVCVQVHLNKYTQIWIH